jgi:hypothetical protein
VFGRGSRAEKKSDRTPEHVRSGRKCTRGIFPSGPGRWRDRFIPRRAKQLGTPHHLALGSHHYPDFLALRCPRRFPPSPPADDQEIPSQLMDGVTEPGGVPQVDRSNMYVPSLHPIPGCWPSTPTSTTLSSLMARVWHLTHCLAVPIIHLYHPFIASRLEI